MLPHWDPAAVVAYRVAVIVMESDFDAVAMPFRGFVDCVVGDFPEQVREPARVRAADVHAGTRPNCFEAL